MWRRSGSSFTNPSSQKSRDAPHASAWPGRSGRQDTTMPVDQYLPVDEITVCSLGWCGPSRPRVEGDAEQRRVQRAGELAVLVAHDDEHLEREAGVVLDLAAQQGGDLPVGGPIQRDVFAGEAFGAGAAGRVDRDRALGVRLRA